MGGVTVPVGAAGRETIEVGDRGRALDGSMLSTVRAYKKRWSVTTSPLSQADAATLETAITGTAPVTCSGDLLGGSISCHPEMGSFDPVPGTSPFVVVVQFALNLA